MSWHLPHRLTNIHHAMSIALLCSVSSVVLLPVAQAATMGKTIITSAQHEPLTASITVTDINAKDFAASLASPVVYQQMGLTPTASMAVRFVATSATTGQLLINTSQPVSMPFADVVLAINDNGQRNVVPKTLLMPLGNNVPIKQPNRVMSGTKKPNLPVVSNSNSKPLTVRRGAPPPLFTSPSMQASVSTPSLPETNSLQTSNVKTLPVMSAVNVPTLPGSQTSNTAIANANVSQVTKATDFSNNSLNGNSSNSSSTLRDTNLIANNSNVGKADKIDHLNINNLEDAAAPNISSTTNNNNGQKNSALGNSVPTADAIGATGNINKQVDILNIQVTRQIQLKEDAINNEASQPIPFANNIEAKSTPSKASLPSSANTTSNDNHNNNAGMTVAAPMSGNTSTATTSYTVQRNDNLWIISQQIAQQNNLDVPTVMKQIKAQNPDAFIAQDADLLKANAELSLPSYDTVPSQQSLQTAIAAQRQYYLQTNPSRTKKTHEKKPTAVESASNAKAIASKRTPSESKTASERSDKPSQVATKTLPKARFSVVAPGRDGSADGTQTKAAAATGNGLSTDILATLKSARQHTAEQAKRVAAANSTLGSYAKKLQLQNQKLAELEARLKKLRNQ
ncbi:hypothetical protein [Psychrobacter sp. P11G5]|uniref:type IV pilus assembly protein FimV n=1 Tax=Psychrobacter sp. P11G5 TaxID=1699624 RepID=UPI00078B86D3|nr:hypothetical protein [Psychrobacter sp. P11G5]AMN67833.1 hypothetical protein AK825_09050 [Psychrobacter sp. P11G5]